MRDSVVVVPTENGKIRYRVIGDEVYQMRNRGWRRCGPGLTEAVLECVDKREAPTGVSPDRALPDGDI